MQSVRMQVRSCNVPIFYCRLTWGPQWKTKAILTRKPNMINGDESDLPDGGQVVDR